MGNNRVCVFFKETLCSAFIDGFVLSFVLLFSTLGFKLKEKCPEKNTRSECVKCENETYLDNSNYNENCFSCMKCNKGNVILKR